MLLVLLPVLLPGTVASAPLGRSESVSSRPETPNWTTLEAQTCYAHADPPFELDIMRL